MLQTRDLMFNEQTDGIVLGAQDDIVSTVLSSSPNGAGGIASSRLTFVRVCVCFRSSLSMMIIISYFLGN